MTEDGPDRPEDDAGHDDADAPRPRTPQGPAEDSDAPASDAPERPDEAGAAPPDAEGPTDPDTPSPSSGDSPAEDQPPVESEEEAEPSVGPETPDEGDKPGEDDVSDEPEAGGDEEAPDGAAASDASDDHSAAGSTSSSDPWNDDYSAGADEWDQGGEDWDNYEDWGEGFDEGWRDDDSDEDEHQDYYYDEYDYQDDTATWQDDDEPPADDEDGAGKKKLAKAGAAALATTDEEEPLDPEEAELAKSTMSLGEHLEELRQRLIRALIGLALAMVGSCFFGNQIIKLLKKSYVIAMEASNLEPNLVTLTVHEAFMTYFKVALISGLVIAAPWVFYQLWQFVAAGLYKRERRYVKVAVPFSATLFISGAAFFLFVVSKPMLMFFIGFNKWMGVTPMITLKQYISFITMLMVVFGLAFQTPLVVFLLGRMGLVSLATLRRYRRHVILVFLVLAAVATSPSPVDQILLALPMWLLYELGVFMVAMAEKKDREAEEAEEAGETSG